MQANSPSHRLPPISTLLLGVLVIVLSLILLVLAAYRFYFLPRIAEAELAQEPSVILEQNNISPTVVVPDGLPGSLLCQESYTAEDAQIADAASRVIAEWDNATLTNAQLQIYYSNAVATYQSSGNEPQPDMTQPLDHQLCPLGDGNLSWQHYFLQQALKSWQSQQILLSAAQEPRIIQEEAYKPNETDDLHGKYVADDLPVNNFLYQDLDCYTPNSMHQEYLDGLDTQLGALVTELGYKNLDDYVKSVYGSHVTAEALVQAAYEYNYSYMYFTEKSYDILDAIGTDNHLGSTRGQDYTVDIRHVLLIPDGAKCAGDGTVTATETQWDLCKATAEQMLNTWKAAYLTTLNAEANFARLANTSSDDGGSQVNGGSYTNLVRGQLIEELDEWCFDPDRSTGDTAIIRSPLGYHIVYFCGSNSLAQSIIHNAQEKKLLLDFVEERREEGTLKVDYSDISLWVDCTAQSFRLSDTLYPDIAHERFPEAMVYFQQDYMYSPYGDSNVGQGGCGITTMAMLATYMTDTVHTPHELASRYSNYHAASGTMGELFRFTPEEMGFFLEKCSSNIDEAIAALENGQRVISLQHLGHFTSGGHYLLLQQYYEEDDTFQVRDSNIYNYGKLDGHKIDRFTRGNILSGGSIFYIMQAKITRIPACSRCGNECDDSAPERLLPDGYLCEKCTAAITRRDIFLELMGS